MFGAARQHDGINPVAACHTRAMPLMTSVLTKLTRYMSKNVLAGLVLLFFRDLSE